MAKSDFLTLATNNAKRYRESAADSVARNEHMHEYRGQPLSQESVDTLLVGFINHIASRLKAEMDHFASMSASNYLDLLTARAKSYRTGLVVEDLEPKAVDALLVDFINFIGQRFGIDFALYTSDLPKP